LLDMPLAPAYELRLFNQHAKLQVIDPEELCSDPKWEIDPKNASLPVAFQSFMANGNLVPVGFKQQVLQVENVVRQAEEQQRQLSSQAGGLFQMLAFGGIQVPAEAMFFVLEVGRSTVVPDTMRLLQSSGPDTLRKPLKVKFRDEEGVDQGGVAKEFFRLLSDQMFSPIFGAFKPDSDSQYVWFDPASFEEPSELRPEEFETFGKVLGLVVYNNLPGFDVSFPPALFKKLKGLPTSMQDLCILFPSHALSLQAVLDWRPPEGLPLQEADQLFQDTFCLDFCVSYEAFGTTKTKVLRGSESSPEAVTLSNRHDFAEAFKDWYLEHGIAAQFEAFRRGFAIVCGSPVYDVLSAVEVEAIVCGEKDLDFANLRKGSAVVQAEVNFREGYMDRLWEVLMAFDVMQKRQFLKFVTGSDIAPVGGLERLGLKIQRNGGEPTDRLPTSQTCFNLLMLPEYSDPAKLKRLLTTAIENAEGFGLQ